MNRSWLGWAELEPGDDVVAGSMASWRLVYHVGRYGVDDGGSVRVARRTVSDMMAPQLADPTGPGYTSVASSGDVRLDSRFMRGGHIRPFSSALQVTARDGSLCEGDTVTIVYGDRGRGCPGLRAQTFREQEHIFKVLVDPFGTGRYEEIEASPSVRIIGGPAERLEMSAPSMAVSGESFEVVVKALDSYGNRSDGYRGKVEFTVEGEAPEPYTFTGDDLGAHRFKVALGGEGVKAVMVADDAGREAESNPVMVRGVKPEYTLFWGDMHGQTKQTVGTGTVDEYFGYVRDVAGMDFGGWQGNDFQITKELWEEVKEKTKLYTEPGRLMLFLGYEWSGLTPAGGDHNIYYLGDDGPLHRSDHWLIDDRSDEDTDRYPISELWKEFRGRDDVLAVAHIGGRHANLDFWDAERVPLIEVHSHHGTFEWFLEEAMRRGLKVGFIATSDDHTCRPGLTLTSNMFTTKGGYTGAYARGLTKEDLWEAFWARRVYGTTGERIILDVRVDGHFMGEEYEADGSPSIAVSVHGTKPLHAVEVMRGTEVVYRHPFAEPVGNGRLIKVEWMGARVRSRPKRVDWGGGLFIDGGRIVGFTEYAFDYLDQGVRRVTNQRLEWASTTGGDPDGVLMKLDAPEKAEVTFYSKPITFRFRPSEVGYEPTVYEVGPVNQRVRVQAITDGPLPRDLEFTYVDGGLGDGVNPYWVKVTQCDGSMAWCSPVYAVHRP
ncbi:DUF3604 domain-containing protein [Candidatus Bathyarchaeota archaeon]|nr:DUF3604 domain-containing protein [Candidatus Bathyarchaeota archaeon]